MTHFKLRSMKCKYNNVGRAGRRANISRKTRLQRGYQHCQKEQLPATTFVPFHYPRADLHGGLPCWFSLLNKPLLLDTLFTNVQESCGKGNTIHRLCLMKVCGPDSSIRGSLIGSTVSSIVSKVMGVIGLLDPAPQYFYLWKIGIYMA